MVFDMDAKEAANGVQANRFGIAPKNPKDVIGQDIERDSDSSGIAKYFMLILATSVGLILLLSLVCCIQQRRKKKMSPDKDLLDTSVSDDERFSAHFALRSRRSSTQSVISQQQTKKKQRGLHLNSSSHLG